MILMCPHHKQADGTSQLPSKGTIEGLWSLSVIVSRPTIGRDI